MMRALVLASALARGPTAIPEPAPAASEAAQAEAAAQFDRGTQAYAAGDFTGALAAFERAQALSPHDRVRANIAMCLAELGRIRDAIDELEAALAGTELDATEREVVRGSLTRLRERLAVLVTTGDAGLAVTIDDRERCTTPCTVELDPGRHALAVADPPLRRSFELRAGERLELALEGPIPPPRPAATTPSERPPRPRRRPSALTWIGVPLAALGTAGTIGFGLRTRQLHADYTAMPEPDLRTRGLRTRALTNASIAVLSLGAALVLADLVRIAVRTRSDRRATTARARRFRGII